ncbi:MAG: heme NO-binding protein [Deltaproteobacteria bacterium]|nr:MAG: heme NO-binding protein [Deltaproteobacteria bacterium]
MKGIVFNLLERCVSDAHGDDMWDDLLEAAGLDGAYTALGNYDDADLRALVGAAARRLGTDEAEIERWFGSTAMGHLAVRYPEIFAPHADLRSFLLALNDIIHPEVRRLYPGVDVPNFGMESESDRSLTLRYRSERQMCAFAVGLIQGAASHFGCPVRVEEPACRKRGADSCVLTCHFLKEEAHG